MYTLHRVVYTVLRPLAALFFWLKFGYTCEKTKDLPERYMVLSNHTTDYDPLLVSLSFPRHMYFVASEHVARWGLASRLLLFFLDPILRYKGSVAASTVKEILGRSRKGANIAIFAEGSRSWDGRTGPILPSTGKLVQKARCGLVTYKLTGGYFVSPRWSQGGTRRGPIYGQIVSVYTAEQVAAMTADQINELICRDLYEDAYARQLTDPRAYKGKILAEKMENLLFLCPHCRAENSLTSQGDRVECSACGGGFSYDTFGMLSGIDFTTVRELSDWQRQQVEMDVAGGGSYHSAQGRLVTVENSVVTPVDSGSVSMTREGLTCGGTFVPMESISELDIHGKRGVVFTADRRYYELIPEGNGLKYFLFYSCCMEREPVKK